MKFKVGDKVRLTREALYNEVAMPTFEEVFGGIIKSIDGGWYITVNGFDDDYLSPSLELVPEEPEFEYGEEIEVSYDEIQREKRIFLTKINWNAILPYVCVADYSHDNFISWSVFSTKDRKYARKLKPQLTRKEIAEKFWVSEDFTLIN